MKKSIIALAVAGAMTAPMMAQADAKLFGEIRWDLDKVEDSKAESNITRVRFGVTGEETMDSGLTAGYFLRFDVGTNASGTGNGKADGNVSAHKTTLWVAGDFGKILFGDSGSPLEESEDRIAYSTFSEDLDILGDGNFTGGGVRYESNVMNGLQFKVGLGNVNNSKEAGISSLGASVAYDTDAFGVTVSAGKDSVDGSKTAWGISADTSFAGFKVGANYAKHDELKGYGVAAKYSVSSKTSVAANYQSSKLEGSDRKTIVTASVNHDLGGNASVNAAYISRNDAAGKDALKLRYKVTF